MFAATDFDSLFLCLLMHEEDRYPCYELLYV
jgi:hypothetical protein